MQQDITLVKMCSMRPIKVSYFLNKYQGYVWFQDDISLAEHSLVGTLKFGITGIRKRK